MLLAAALMTQIWSCSLMKMLLRLHNFTLQSPHHMLRNLVMLTDKLCTNIHHNTMEISLPLLSLKQTNLKIPLFKQTNLEHLVLTFPDPFLLNIHHNIMEMFLFHLFPKQTNLEIHLFRLSLKQTNLDPLILTFPDSKLSSYLFLHTIRTTVNISCDYIFLFYV